MLFNSVECVSYQPGDMVPFYVIHEFVYEYDNPKDSIMRVSFASFDAKDTTRIKDGYDGMVRLLIWQAP